VKIVSVCPKELRKGDVKDYHKAVAVMILAYRKGNYTDITNEKL